VKLFCCYTPAHGVLFTDYFLPSVPRVFSVIPFKLEIQGAGDFLSREFIECICRKLDLILRSIRENDGDVIVWSDIDIQFVDVRPEILLEQLGEHDIAFQREGRKVTDINSGFLICRCHPRVAAFFARVKERLRQSMSTNEQYVINDLLREGGADVSWTYLPITYYARTHGWPPPRDLVLYHANATPGKNGVQKKIRQFRELDFLRRHRIPALIITSIKYAPKRLIRLASEFFTGLGAGGRNSQPG